MQHPVARAAVRPLMIGRGPSGHKSAKILPGLDLSHFASKPGAVEAIAKSPTFRSLHWNEGIRTSSGWHGKAQGIYQS